MAEAATATADGKQTRRRAPAPAKVESYNLNGQRLGRKGRDTRDRILAATQEILSEPSDGSLLTLSEVARRASLRMGTLYIYFADLTELVLAVLEPVMATAEDDYVHLVREYWPDEELAERALAFVTAYHGFWLKHGRVLHLRNNMGDRGDERMMQHRVRMALPVMRLIINQMDPGSAAQGNIVSSTATALMTGLDRVATVLTEGKLPLVVDEPANPLILLLQAQARLFELAIRDQREQAKSRA
jgi:AcrR family transcriptional regulator